MNVDWSLPPRERRIISTPEVREVWGLAAEGVALLLSRGLFPMPVAVGPEGRAFLYLADDVEAFMQAPDGRRQAVRDTAQDPE